MPLRRRRSKVKEPRGHDLWRLRYIDDTLWVVTEEGRVVFGTQAGSRQMIFLKGEWSIDVSESDSPVSCGRR